MYVQLLKSGDDEQLATIRFLHARPLVLRKSNPKANIFGSFSGITIEEGRKQSIKLGLQELMTNQTYTDAVTEAQTVNQHHGENNVMNIYR